MTKSNRWKIWIDTGGTFTDCVAETPDKNRKYLKVLSNSSLRGRITSIHGNFVKVETSWDIQTDILQGYHFTVAGYDQSYDIITYNPIDNTLELSAPLKPNTTGKDFSISASEEVPVLAARILTETSLDSQLPPIDLRLGSTKGTNALLERKVAKTAFVTTKGFKDLILINNQQRPEIFSLNVVKPVPFYSHVFELDERVAADGTVLKSVQTEQLGELVTFLRKHNVESVAVATLFSYRNPENENKVEEYLNQKGFRYISVSNKLYSAIKILPRAETAVVNGCLAPIIESYLAGIKSKLSESSTFKIMTSAGGLANFQSFFPKDSLLSGPAGGLVGSRISARNTGSERVITFDMGGTSTDVSRYDSNFDYTFETEVGGAKILSPALRIETIAAGGGSICTFDQGKFKVGPESAGSYPGPACYGAGGPLTVTDVNLLLHKINPQNFGIPVHIQQAEKALDSIKEKIEQEENVSYSKQEILKGFERIANEKMAEALRKIAVSKGYSPSEHTIIAFGGAGGQHACQIADLLDIQKVIVPDKAGLLSAMGIGNSLIEKFQTRQILKVYSEQVKSEIEAHFLTMESKINELLQLDGLGKENIEIRNQLVYCRLLGQDTTIELEWDDGDRFEERFQIAYEKLYNHWIDNQEIEIESIKCIGTEKIQPIIESANKNLSLTDEISLKGSFDRNTLPAFRLISGPSIIGSQTHTTYVPEGWVAHLDSNRNEILERSKGIERNTDETPELANLELFINRFSGVANEMGAVLQKASFSVNIKERLDFSCAILDKNGYLVVNAPHIPVHLGSLGVCVREVLKNKTLEDGDIVITNHPGYGGSHLPDITLISPIFIENELLGYVANRAHHSEIGGKTPGSMPVDASHLEDEGVIIEPDFLFRKGKPRWTEIEHIFQSAKWPSRSIKENMADLKGAVASIHYGIQGMKKLVSTYSFLEVSTYLDKILDYSSRLMTEFIRRSEIKELKATEYLDDNSILSVSISKDLESLVIDFEGSSPTHKGNMNATSAITTSATLYVLRLLIDQPIPLNEGLLRPVHIRIPEDSILNPNFNIPNPPAVVGGNTETSQRLTDTLLKAFKVAACSQGTMNNVLFGNNSFGYYETICGGVGAIDGHAGADAVHQHMTNTRITDAEIIEQRYPVRINEFSIRKDSGGDGIWKGGNGAIREFEFIEECELTTLTEHRIQPPYGLSGGTPGSTGEQKVIRTDGTVETLNGKDYRKMYPGDTFIISTPGGGGHTKTDP